MTTKKERGLLRLFIPAGEAPLLFIQKSDFKEGFSLEGKKKKFNVPHVYILLLAMILVF